MSDKAERGRVERLVMRLRRYAGEVCLSSPAEIEAAKMLEELVESVHLANGCAELAMKHRDIAEEESSVLRSALEEAEDVLRKVGCDMTADMAKAALAHNAAVTRHHTKEQSK